MSEENLKKARKRSLASHENYRKVFDSFIGKKVLYDLMKESGFLLAGIEIDNANHAIYNEGKRSMVLYIMNKISVDPKKLEQLIKEGIEDEHEIWNT
jgi:hypothetical protein